MNNMLLIVGNAPQAHSKRTQKYTRCGRVRRTACSHTVMDFDAVPRTRRQVEHRVQREVLPETSAPRLNPTPPLRTAAHSLVARIPARQMQRWRRHRQQERRAEETYLRQARTPIAAHGATCRWHRQRRRCVWCVCECVYMRGCVRGCVRSWVRSWVRVCVRACARAWVRASARTCL